MNLLYHLNYIYFSLLVTSWFVVSASISTDIQSKRDSSLDCPSAELVSYVNYNYNNSEISLRTFSCTDLSIQETTGPNTQSLKLSSPARTTSSYRTNSLQGRNEEQCKTTGDECQCGTASDCTCHGGTTLPPSTNECSILVASLTVLEEFNGSSFIVSPGSFVTLSYLTCSFEFINLSTSDIEYCWDELGTALGLASQQCFAAATGSAQTCNALSGLWVLQIFRSFS